MIPIQRGATKKKKKNIFQEKIRDLVVLIIVILLNGFVNVDETCVKATNIFLYLIVMGLLCVPLRVHIFDHEPGNSQINQKLISLTQNRAESHWHTNFNLFLDNKKM